MQQLPIIFLIIFVIYGAGWIWQTVSDILREAHRGWDAPPGGAPRAPRMLLGGHDLEELGRAFERFAELRGGDVHWRLPLQTPKVSFAHQGARALLSIYEGGEPVGPVHTQLTYTVPEGWPFRLEVASQATSAERGLGPGDLRTGDPEFDARYSVKSNDPAFARDFLDAAARHTLEDLRRLRGDEPVLVSVNSSRLMVRRQSVLALPDDLAHLADLAGRLHDRIELLWQRASGIEILEDVPAALDRPPTCQICGSPIPPEARVNCRRCGTPHHRDCWEFNGQCSTYACGEKRFATKK